MTGDQKMSGNGKKILKPTQVNALTKTTAVGDPPGLTVVVQTNKKTGTITRSYVLRMRGRNFTIGAIGRIKLKDARIEALRLKEEIEKGGDPTARKRAARLPAQSVLSLEALYLEHLSRSVSNGKMTEAAAKDYRARFLRYLPEALRQQPAASVQASDIAEGVRPEWERTKEAARRMLLILAKAFEAAMALGNLPRGQNPARFKDGLEYLLPPPSKDKDHHPALPPEDIPAFFANLLDGRDALPPSVAFIAFTILTANRAGAVLPSLWTEIDRKTAVQTIPRARMKIKHGTDRVCPLSPAALRILDSVPRLTSNPYVFASTNGSRCRTHISQGAYDSTLSHLHNAAGGPWVDPYEKDREGAARRITLHGTARATFKDWAKDGKRFGHPDFPEALIERCLDHCEKYAGAYDRRGPVEEMRGVFDHWGRYCFSALREQNRWGTP